MPTGNTALDARFKFSQDDWGVFGGEQLVEDDHNDGWADAAMKANFDKILND